MAVLSRHDLVHYLANYTLVDISSRRTREAAGCDYHYVQQMQRQQSAWFD